MASSYGRSSITSMPSRDRCGKIFDSERDASRRKIFSRSSASSSARSGTYIAIDMSWLSSSVEHCAQVLDRLL